MEDLQIFDLYNNKIGSGSSSDVYKVYDEQRGKYYACKIFRKLENVEAAQILEQEVRIISQIKHPLILQLIKSGKITRDGNDQYVLITDFYQNGTLKDILNLSKEKQEEIGWNDTRKLIFIYFIAIAMSYLHEKKIVHRDLKPENIFISEYLQPVIGDFGISKQIDNSIIEFSKLVGSPSYMAPEIHSGDNYTKEIDVYAFAIIVLEILTNTPPYKSISNYFLFATNVIKGQRPQIQSTVPEAFKKLIEICWDGEPSKRYTFDQIIDRLEKDPSFITENINTQDFYSCIEYAKQFRKEYDPNKPICQIDHFVTHPTSTFKRIIINEQTISEKDVNLYYHRGLNFESGLNGNEINKEEAARCFKLAADNGHINSMYKYGYMLYTGDGIKTDEKEAVKYLEKVAYKGHADAMYYYSKILSKSELQIDQERSNMYLELSVNKGQLQAMNDYALKLLNGEYSTQNTEQALLILKRAADKGNVESMLNYGKLLDKSEFEQDQTKRLTNKKEACVYYKTAADNNNKEAMLLYANKLRNGEGIPRDLKEANRYFELASQKIEKKEWFILDSVNDEFTIFDENIKKDKFYIKKGKVKTTNQLVAVKLKCRDKVNDLENQCNNLLRCSHPCIQKVIGFYKTPDNLASTLITYYQRNLSLDEKLILNEEEENEIDDDELNPEINSIHSFKYSVIYGVCSAMKYLEDNNMFHGQLIPKNILLDENNHPILNNIKMKKNYSIDELNTDDLIINYFAPEVILGNECSIKSDVYSFGLIVNQLFSKKVPHSSMKTKKNIIDDIINNKIEISSTVPKFISSIIKDCFNQNPDERISFNKLLSLLQESFYHNTIIDRYQRLINGLIQCPITFFRAPKLIVRSPVETDLNKASANFFDLDVLEKVFSTVSYDRNIKIIMVCGKYQSGKSTFLRTITGNGGFFIGEGIRTTTNGILIDGPYSIKDIINRIGTKSFKKMFSPSTDEEVGNNCIEEDPAIFFIDSQGIGDEDSQIYNDLMKRYLSFFCTISDLCINICDMTEHFDVTKEIINIIRTGQSSKKIAINDNDNDNENNNTNNDISINRNTDIESFKELTKIIFLVKRYKNLYEEINNKNEFSRIQKSFEKEWCSTHKDVQIKYLKSLLKPLPLGDPNVFLSTYNCSVWNSIPDIVSFLKESPNHTKDYIQAKIEIAFKFLFSEFSDQFSSQFEDINDQIDFIAKASLELLNNTIKQYKSNLKNKEQTIDLIRTHFYAIRIIVPYILGKNSNSSFREINQCTYDLMKDLSAYIMKKLPQLKENLFANLKDFFLTDSLKFVGGGIASGGTVIASTVAANLAKEALIQTIKNTIPLFIPGGAIVTIVSVVSACISVGSFFGWMLKKYYQRSTAIKEIMTQDIQLTTNFLWKKTISSKSSKKLITNLATPKKVSSHFKFFDIKHFFIVLETPNSNFMKFIIQCMTGIETNYESILNNKKESILFGPFKPTDLVQRSSRCFPLFESSILKDIFILYLRDYNQDDLKSIENVQMTTSFFLSSTQSINIDFYPTVNKPLLLFYSMEKDFNDDKFILLTKDDCVTFYNKKKIKSADNEFDVLYFPILMNNFNDFKKIGPLTNKCLRWSFNQILKRKRIEIEEKE